MGNHFEPLVGRFIMVRRLAKLGIRQTIMRIVVGTAPLLG
jgi:hypothetical protein